MIEIILSFLIFLIAVLAMCIGVFSGRRGLQGSCGGLNKIPGVNSDCDGRCQKPCPNKKNI